MKTPSYRLSFLFLTTMLIIAQLSSCRTIQRRGDELHRSLTAKFFPKFAKQVSTKSFKDNNTKDQIDPVYGVSMREVPGGPNPLHNWSLSKTCRWSHKLLQIIAIFSLQLYTSSGRDVYCLIDTLSKRNASLCILLETCNCTKRRWQSTICS